MSTQTKWSIDQKHTNITFKVKHLMIASVKGWFKTFDASIYTTDKNFRTAEIDFFIDAASIGTGDKQRDEHLKSKEFFDVKNYPQISFTSSTIDKVQPNGKHELWGELTIKGITKNVQLDVEFGGVVKDPWGIEKAGFTVTGKIKRSDFNLVWNTPIENGGLMVSDEVMLACEMELINTSPNALTMEIETTIEKNEFNLGL